LYPPGVLLVCEMVCLIAYIASGYTSGLPWNGDLPQLYTNCDHHTSRSSAFWRALSGRLWGVDVVKQNFRRHVGLFFAQPLLYAGHDHPQFAAARLLYGPLDVGVHRLQLQFPLLELLGLVDVPVHGHLRSFPSAWPSVAPNLAPPRFGEAIVIDAADSLEGDVAPYLNLLNASQAPSFYHSFPILSSNCEGASQILRYLLISLFCSSI